MEAPRENRPLQNTCADDCIIQAMEHYFPGIDLRYPDTAQGYTDEQCLLQEIGTCCVGTSNTLTGEDISAEKLIETIKELNTESIYMIRSGSDAGSGHFRTLFYKDGAWKVTTTEGESQALFGDSGHLTTESDELFLGVKPQKIDIFELTLQRAIMGMNYIAEVRSTPLSEEQKALSSAEKEQFLSQQALENVERHNAQSGESFIQLTEKAKSYWKGDYTSSIALYFLNEDNKKESITQQYLYLFLNMGRAEAFDELKKLGITANDYWDSDDKKESLLSEAILFNSTKSIKRLFAEGAVLDESAINSFLVESKKKREAAELNTERMRDLLSTMKENNTTRPQYHERSSTTQENLLITDKYISIKVAEESFENTHRQMINLIDFASFYQNTPSDDWGSHLKILIDQRQQTAIYALGTSAQMANINQSIVSDLFSVIPYQERKKNLKILSSFLNEAYPDTLGPFVHVCMQQSLREAEINAEKTAITEAVRTSTSQARPVAIDLSTHRNTLKESAVSAFKAWIPKIKDDASCYYAVDCLLENLKSIYTDETQEAAQSNILQVLDQLLRDSSIKEAIRNDILVQMQREYGINKKLTLAEYVNTTLENASQTKTSSSSFKEVFSSKKRHQIVELLNTHHEKLIESYGFKRTISPVARSRSGITVSFGATSSPSSTTPSAQESNYQQRGTKTQINQKPSGELTLTVDATSLAKKQQDAIRLSALLFLENYKDGNKIHITSNASNQEAMHEIYCALLVLRPELKERILINGDKPKDAEQKESVLKTHQAAFDSNHQMLVHSLDSLSNTPVKVTNASHEQVTADDLDLDLGKEGESPLILEDLFENTEQTSERDENLNSHSVLGRSL